MVDSSRILGDDHGLLTNMSYVKDEDFSGSRLHLAKKPENGSNEPQFELELVSKAGKGDYRSIG